MFQVKRWMEGMMEEKVINHSLNVIKVIIAFFKYFRFDDAYLFN